jgi:hypothetical protein
VAVAAVLLVIQGLLADLPFLWSYLFPGGKDPGALLFYAGLALGLAAVIVAGYVAVQMWRLRSWAWWGALGLAGFHLFASVLAMTEVTVPRLRDTYAVFAFVAALIIGLILLPVSRRSLRRT